jgi:predicted alpha/beta hydrolase
LSLQTFEITALDGFKIYGRKYSPEEVKGRIVVASATGVPQGFYQNFAQRAASRGFEVITFDYRGIGESAPTKLRGFKVDYRDWARLDLAGVLESQKDDLGVHLVGHSYGGQALGILPDLSKIKSLHTFATGAGWQGWMPKGEQIRVKFLWNVIGPIITRTKGYLAWKRLGFGEDLPLGVYRQWKYWCGFPNYWFDDPSEGSQMQSSFARVRVPITALNAIDDDWATPASRDAFMKHYINSDLRLIDLNPAELQLKSIGHMGYFRRGSEALWDRVFDDIERLYK